MPVSTSFFYRALHFRYDHTMTRAIAFDLDRAVNEAIRLFWRHGYAGTSLRGLLKAMGIGEGSFYNTLGSKKRLYLQCLHRYEETEGRKRALALMSAPTAGEGVRALFGTVLDCLDDPQAPSRLCMMAAMVSEDVLADPDLRAMVEGNLAELQARLHERLSHDQETGALSATLDAAATASVIATYAQGIWRMAMVDYDRPRFERQVDVFLTGLGL